MKSIVESFDELIGLESRLEHVMKYVAAKHESHASNFFQATYKNG